MFKIQKELNQFHISSFTHSAKFKRKRNGLFTKKHIFVAAWHKLPEKPDISAIAPFAVYLLQPDMFNPTKKSVFALLGTLLLLTACNNQSDKQAQHPTSNHTNDTVQVEIPEWLLGTWSGKFDVDTQNSDYEILISLLIDASGTVIQTSSDNSSPVEMLMGQCTDIDSRLMTVQFDNDTEKTEYLLDYKNKRIAIGNNTWLNKNNE